MYISTYIYINIYIHVYIHIYRLYLSYMKKISEIFTQTLTHPPMHVPGRGAWDDQQSFAKTSGTTSTTPPKTFPPIGVRWWVGFGMEIWELGGGFTMIPGENDPIWLSAYFSNGLKQPPTSPFIHCLSKIYPSHRIRIWYIWLTYSIWDVKVWYMQKESALSSSR